jgi:uncharacterized phage-associated protein
MPRGEAMTIDDACDYIILKMTEGGGPLNVIKLQKLTYYAQAWHLAFYENPLFPGKFQAWVHGPVSRELYDRFKDSKTLYSPVGAGDVRSDFDPESLDSGKRQHIDTVLEVYAPFTGSQLEEMTHREEPWIRARAGRRPSERCENALDEGVMQRYYAAKAEPAGG